MRRNKGSFRCGTVLMLLLMTVLLLTGCGRDERLTLSEIETAPVSDEYGLSLIIPADWQEQELNAPEPLDEDEQWQDEYILHAYLTADAQGSVLLLSERGGMEYADSFENMQKLCDGLAERFASAQMSGISGNDEHCTQLITASDAEGREFVCRVEQWHPFTSLRYYLLFTATEQCYEQNERILDGVADSFRQTLSDEQVYELIDDKRDAEEAALLEQLEEQSEEN